MNAANPARPHELETALALESSQTDVYRAPAPEAPPEQVYGGHIAAQALRAAAQTARRDQRPHSLHTYFLNPGRPAAELTYRVRRTRDSSSFSARSVDVEQDGELLAQVSTSFVCGRTAPDYQTAMPIAPKPDELANLSELVKDDPDAWSSLYRHWDHFDVRYAVPPRARLRAEPPPTDAQVWIRSCNPQPPGTVWNACALAYVSDLTLLAVTLPVQGLRPALPELRMASLDHIVWFHRPCNIDDWLLYDQTVVSTSGSLALAMGRIFSASGAHVATVMQEGMVRQSQPAEHPR